MSSLRLAAVPVCALLLSIACGRTEAVFVATGADTGGDTWSYEATGTTPIDDVPGWETVAEDESSTDDWMTGEWGEDDPDTWDESTDVDTLDSPDVDIDWGTEDFDTTDFDTDTNTTDTNTTDTNTDTTDTNTDTTDTNTDTTDTTDTNTDTTDTNTTDTNTDTTDTNTTDTNTDTTDTTDTTTTDTGGDTCADAAACLVDCGNFSGQCIGDCAANLPNDEANNLYDLQICAIQSCFFLGECLLGDFNAPECIQCRLDVNVDPQGMGCGPEGAICGI